MQAMYLLFAGTLLLRCIAVSLLCCFAPSWSLIHGFIGLLAYLRTYVLERAHEFIHSWTRVFMDAVTHLLTDLLHRFTDAIH